MRRRGVSESDVAATADYTVTRQEVALEINWAFGLTRNWMIGMRLPLTHRTTRVRESVEMTPTLLSGVQATSGADLSGHVRQLAQSQLSNSGYDRVPAEKQSWDWGDISLLNQESLLQARRWQVSLQELVRFPTAQSPSIADYIQTNNDEGQVDIGATVLADYQTSRWMVGTRFGYVMQLPDTTRMRTALNSSQSDTANPSVRRDLGDWVWGAIGTDIKVARHWNVNFEHAFLSKARDSYSGDSLSGTEYAHLADNSDQQLQQSQVGIQYRIGGSGQRDGVVNRWSTSVDYTYPWTGRNAADDSKTTLEITSHF